MPCYKCSNGKYKYGESGRCQFDTLAACRAAEAAIHARKPKKDLEAENTRQGCGNCKKCSCPDKKLDSSIG